jgi:CDP-glucose 4,6-dehydratase
LAERQSAVEGLGVRMFGDTYRGRRVLVTGHTGFKGSWLALWLHALGARLTGVALSPPTDPNHWDLLDLQMTDRRLDIREFAALASVVAEARPEIVFHLAAQPLVRRSYRDPLETWSTNLLGTANLLEACRLTSGIRAIVVITTDKCYQNCEWVWGYRENDRLGGHDPYSASKAGAELVAASYRSAFFTDADAPLLATARAGNVIGGGDWSEDRLIPDLVRALATGAPLAIRFPQATRPWQHVLESLSGYLLLGQKLLEGRREMAGAWNFGPYPRDNRTVGEILERLRDHWPELTWTVSPEPQPHEASLLYLDSTKARQLLGWRPVWELEEGLRATAGWYRRFRDSGAACSREQLDQYLSAARAAGLLWRQS